MKMKDIDSEYFHIEKAHLKGERIFGFNLFIFHPVSAKYTVYLYGNSPLTSEKMEFLDFLLSKGGELAVSRKQSKTFLRSLDHKQEDIPSLREKEEDPLEKRGRELKEVLATESEDIFPFKEVLGLASQSNDYLAIIRRARLEIMAFSPRVSPCVSLASYFAEHLLKEDNHTNRTVAISYFLAKNLDMKDESTLGDLVCAAYLAHIGLTQLDLFYSQNACLNFSPKQKNKFEKHPGLAHHILRKSKVELNERVLKIIEDHHERDDGRGYPRGIMGSALEPLSLILGAVSHVLEYSAGMVTGSPVPLASVLRNLKEKTFAPGLEFQFGDTIYDNLINLLSTNTDTEENQAS